MCQFNNLRVNTLTVLDIGTINNNFSFSILEMFIPLVLPKSIRTVFNVLEWSQLEPLPFQAFQLA